MNAASTISSESLMEYFVDGARKAPFTTFRSLSKENADLRHYCVALFTPGRFDSLNPYPASFLGWMKGQITQCHNMGDPLWESLLEQCLGVISDHRELVEAVDFGIEFYQRMRSDNRVARMIFAAMKRERVYWEIRLDSFFERLLRGFRTPSEKGYSAEDWVQVERVVNAAVDEEDASFLPVLNALVRALDLGEVHPVQSLGLFAREDHFHFLRSRCEFLIKKLNFQTPCYEFFKTKIATLAHLDPKDVSIGLDIARPRPGEAEIILEVAARAPENRAAVLGVLKEFKVWIQPDPKPYFPNEFDRNTGQCRFTVATSGRTSRLWLQVDYEKGIVLPRSAVYVAG